MVKRFFFDNPPGYDEPEWKRSVMIDEEGVIYAPASVTDDEKGALVRAVGDGGVPLIMDRDHVYLPTGWLAAEYPEVASICHWIEGRFGDFQRRN